MPRNPWHILEEPGVLTLSRHKAPRFDVAAETVLPGGDPVAAGEPDPPGSVARAPPPARLRPRGAVEIGPPHRIRAGGAAPATTQGTVTTIEALLTNPANRVRWVAYASRPLK